MAAQPFHSTPPPPCYVTGAWGAQFIGAAARAHSEPPAPTRQNVRTSLFKINRKNKNLEKIIKQKALTVTGQRASYSFLEAGGERRRSFLFKFYFESWITAARSEDEELRPSSGGAEQLLLTVNTSSHTVSWPVHMCSVWRDMSSLLTLGGKLIYKGLWGR